jgi:hypothetical protein
MKLRRHVGNADSAALPKQPSETETSSYAER